jgi:hypothetical protein
VGPIALLSTPTNELPDYEQGRHPLDLEEIADYDVSYVPNTEMKMQTLTEDIISTIKAASTE